ncbi:AAA family ATPase [Dictyobacter arantiisoli]|uniref:UDP-N-acetylglucosamine kinase n=1 Tax=Dictyobacter arantiisoli TaxID=2014874 RepID=A0A5A5TB81_9CHLR|nr:AAA family ATPase [Dictyobacter arantiisoli]GCF08273.1 hypothetical protein KDI_18370 [Dictyobacter arantiisoli]
MLVKVFVLGRPGSGKTTAIHHLLKLARQSNFTALHMDDYRILHRMSQEDTRHIRFRTTAYGGFDVLDLSVFDTALHILEQQVQALANLEQDGIVTIEFARNDYWQALQQFSAGFLQDAYVFFVDADLDTCIDRIYQRIESSEVTNNHFVSDYIMRTYYDHDNWLYMCSHMNAHLRSEQQIYKEVRAFRNAGNLQALLDIIEDFAKQLFQREFQQTIIPQKVLTHA